jgi:alkanesulfonate monooxygenase SsuD/methylene tetrahydromethanopterin reductase-like flavin-dependent oxidoreductase (luciferase family)
MHLGRLGVWYPVDRLEAAGLRSFVALVEQLGYDTLWYPESRGYESLSVAGFMLGASTHLKLGSSIASIYARDAFTAGRDLVTLRGLYGEVCLETASGTGAGARAHRSRRAPIEAA